jgi:hypothetical protein
MARRKASSALLGGGLGRLKFLRLLLAIQLPRQRRLGQVGTVRAECEARAVLQFLGPFPQHSLLPGRLKTTGNGRLVVGPHQIAGTIDLADRLSHHALTSRELHAIDNILDRR